jgi:hypothetical protein
MGFEVRAGDLDGYATQVARAAEDMQAAGTYSQQHTAINVSNKGLIEYIVGAHRSVVGEVKSAMISAEAVLRAAQTELTKSAAYYRATDESNAASQDATYPASKR